MSDTIYCECKKCSTGEMDDCFQNKNGIYLCEECMEKYPDLDNCKEHGLFENFSETPWVCPVCEYNNLTLK